MIKKINNFINGRFENSTSKTIPVWNPQNGEKLTEVTCSSKKELNNAVSSAKSAFCKWSNITLKERVEVFYEFRNELKNNITSLANSICQENGKTFEEARAEILKGIELTEFACSMPQIIHDEIQEVSRGVECRSSHVPLGIVASITPFNFPIMVPMWTVPNAIVLGNCMILKPSEQTPVGASKIAELLKKSGLPDGVFNVINGDKNIVEAICDHKDISAISFVGSTKIAKNVYQRTTSNFKRCLSLGGAKNHLIVLPDANEEMASNDIIASMSGCAGQRCMAASAMLGVGKIDSIINKIANKAKTIVAGKNLGSVISEEAKIRIEKYIEEAEKSGAKIILDGRGVKVSGKENGYYVGPTILDHVKPEMKIAKEEVFGPVLAIIRTNEIDEAIAIENNSQYGNASSVYTQDGNLANYVTEKVSAGMVGVNIGVPVPREPFSFGGWNESRFGVGDITGKSSINFWTQLKKRTSKWNQSAKKNWMS
ncbi:MAG TPA: CoA-acylating methylmalonate-semialdehyde dehydrogenase [Cytophagales bacterium]|jgi:malonate-semialdehyde dehydrogenase (acetylating)/methylmalonate-semialdehyde dehydrogenase|nr:CoA-acylating methylmalonate-semialdehyde dehydrogenase [Cytophagales bacterium]